MKTASKKKPTLKQVLDAALSLGKSDRRKLRDAIDGTLASEPKSVDDMNDDELEAELNRRAAEAKRDPSVLIPWETVRDHARKKYLCE